MVRSSVLERFSPMRWLLLVTIATACSSPSSPGSRSMAPLPAGSAASNAASGATSDSRGGAAAAGTTGNPATSDAASDATSGGGAGAASASGAPVAPQLSQPVPGHGPAEVVPKTALAPGACNDAPLLPPSQIGADMPDGERVSVEGIPKPSLICTAQACPGDQACCNGCGGGYVVHVGNGQVSLLGLPGCTGMDCNYRCEPFGNAPKTRYRFVGTTNFGQITVEKYCRVTK